MPVRARLLPAALAALLTFGATGAAAQAPRITPKGDPSVRADTIYRLAVNPADYPDDAIVVLLDDGVVRYEADGRGVRTFRSVVQILKPEAVERYSEHALGYSPRHQKLTVNWMRVVRPDGQVVSDKPAQVQDADVPASMGDPVYTDRKVRRASLAGVAVGTIVDYSYTTEELKPFRPGDWYQPWSVSMAVPVRRSRFIVDVPADVEPRVLERNLTFARTTVVANGRRVLTWAAADVPAFEGEPFAADSNGVLQHVAVAAPGSWTDIARWYAGLARDRYTLDGAAEAKLGQVLAAAAPRTLDDTLRAVHRWVAQDVRYVSLALGIGGYQPRTPAQVVETGFGDCKDKATMFVAALAKLGVTAYPVLLNSEGAVERGMPSIDQFDHAIAAVRRPGRAGYLFVDLTSDLTPLGQLPPAEQGAFALVVHPDGTGEEVTMPEDPTSANKSEELLVGTLTPDGTFNGRFEERATGSRQYSLRGRFWTPPDSAARAGLLRKQATSLFDGAVGDSLVAFDGKDLTAEPRMAMVVRNGKATKHLGDSELLHLPMGSMSAFGNLAAELETRPARRYPIDAAEVVGTHEIISEMRVTLPAGWRAHLPQGVSAASPFGSYTSEYVQSGQELRIRRHFVGAKGVLPPDRFGELVAWLKAVGKDDADFIVLDKK